MPESRDIFRDRLGIPAGEVTVRLRVEGHDPTAEFTKKPRTSETAGPVTGIERDSEVSCRDRLPNSGCFEVLKEFLTVRFPHPRNCSARSDVPVPDGPGRRRGEPCFDPFQRSRREFDSVGADQLHAVVRRWIVTRRNHHHGDRMPFGVRLCTRGRHDPETMNRTPAAGERTRSGVDQHLTGGSRIPGDRERLGVENRPGGCRYFPYERRRELLADDAANSARPENVHVRSLGVGRQSGFQGVLGTETTGYPEATDKRRPGGRAKVSAVRITTMDWIRL